jgi:protein-disulfide isomerase
MKPIRFLLTATILSSLTSHAMAQEANDVANPNAPVTRSEFQDMVRKAIMDEPEMIMKAVYKLRDQQEEESKRATAESFAKHKTELQNDKVSPQIGSSNPDVTVIMFFDYHCGFCKKLLPTITQLVNEDKKVRVIFREYPILSEDSVQASRAALAVNRIAPDKYFAYHSALMQSKAQFNEEALLSMASKVGVDANALKKEMEKPVITDLLSQNRNIGEELGVRGTPALFVGEKMLPGAVAYDTLKRIVNEVRTGKTDAKKAP